MRAAPAEVTERQDALLRLPEAAFPKTAGCCVHTAAFPRPAARSHAVRDAGRDCPGRHGALCASDFCTKWHSTPTPHPLPAGTALRPPRLSTGHLTLGPGSCWALGALGDRDACTPVRIPAPRREDTGGRTGDHHGLWRDTVGEGELRSRGPGRVTGRPPALPRGKEEASGRCTGNTCFSSARRERAFLRRALLPSSVPTPTCPCV